MGNKKRKKKNGFLFTSIYVGKKQHTSNDCPGSFKLPCRTAIAKFEDNFIFFHSKYKI